MAVTLVLRALGLGDLLTGVPALRGLRRARPDDEIVLAAPAALAPLVTLIDAVDELLPTPGLGALRGRDLPSPPELAVNLHGRGPRSIADLLGTRPATIITHRNPAHPELAGPEWDDEVHEVRRWCDLLGHHGIAADPAELSLPAPDVPSPRPGAVVIHPGAASPARRWPPHRFARLARALAESGRPVVITGGESERSLAAEVAERAGLGPGAVLAGQDLARMAALVADAALVVCGDTGVGHLATAFGTPSVLLFGPTPPSRWGPPADRPRHRVLWAGTVGDPHADVCDPGLLRLTVPEVVRAARTQLVGGKSCQDSTPDPAPAPPNTHRPPGGSRWASSAPATSD